MAVFLAKKDFRLPEKRQEIPDCGFFGKEKVSGCLKKTAGLMPPFAGKCRRKVYALFFRFAQCFTQNLSGSLKNGRKLPIEVFLAKKDFRLPEKNGGISPPFAGKCRRRVYALFFRFAQCFTQNLSDSLKNGRKFPIAGFLAKKRFQAARKTAGNSRLRIFWQRKGFRQPKKTAGNSRWRIFW